MNRYNLIAAAVLAGLTFSAPARADLDVGRLIGAGKDLAAATSLSDAEVRQLAAGASRRYDGANRVAPPDSPYAQRLAKLTAGMRTGGVKTNMKVYLKNEMNAFAMADGTVRVFSGLMDRMTDDELRYVIGHEIGHVHLGHSRKALQTAYAASAARKAVGAGDGKLAALSDSALGDLAQKLVNAQFSQAQESEADLHALGLMKENGYDRRAAVSALRKLEQQFGNQRSAFSSHPAPGDRAAALERRLAGKA